MTEPTPPATPPVEPGKGTDPQNPGEPGKAFDPTSLKDEDIIRVLEDKRLWQSTRLKELLDSQKELKALKDKQTEEEKKHLEEQGQFKELSEKNAKERDEALQRANQLQLKQAIFAEAVKKGVTDLELVDKLIDTKSIKTNDDGTYTGITESVDALIKERPFLTTTTTSVGNPTTPATPATPPGTYTLTQLGDPKFYQDNREDILKAQREGRIVDDRLQPSKTAS